jgi:hypothetical protein
MNRHSYTHYKGQLYKQAEKPFFPQGNTKDTYGKEIEDIRPQEKGDKVQHINEIQPQKRIIIEVITCFSSQNINDDSQGFSDDNLKKHPISSDGKSRTREIE